MRIFQRFEYTKPVVKLGEGAFSQAYRVKEISSGQSFALKVIELSQLEPEEMINFEKEIEI